jgi:hypothetical protein
MADLQDATAWSRWRPRRAIRTDKRRAVRGSTLIPVQTQLGAWCGSGCVIAPGGFIAL